MLDFTCQTARKRNQPFAVRSQNILVNTRFIVVSVDKSLGDYLNQILISGFIFYKQNQMALPFIFFRILIRQSARGSIDLTADNRLDALLPALFIEVHYAEHHAVIRNRKAVHAKLFGTRHYILDSGCTIQQTVFRMYMQMRKCHRFSFAFVLILSLILNSALQHLAVCAVKLLAVHRLICTDFDIIGFAFFEACHGFAQCLAACGRFYDILRELAAG